MPPMGWINDPAGFRRSRKAWHDVAKPFHKAKFTDAFAGIYGLYDPIAVTEYGPAADSALDLLPQVRTGPGLATNKFRRFRLCPDPREWVKIVQAVPP